MYLSSRRFDPCQKLRAIIPSSVTSWPDLIKGLGWFGQRLLGNLGDLGDSLAQVDLYPDPIAIGDLLLLQDVGVGNYTNTITATINF